MPSPIELAARLGLTASEVVPYGRDVAKLDLAGRAPRSTRGRLILVSAITPTPAGEGKTTTSIGLADALALAGQSVCLALREPSMGPVFGAKGGGTGGGRAALVPADRINLHFTGDFHAVAAAHNLLAAALDNHVHFGAAPILDPRRLLWKRVLDVNDRALRHVVLGLGGKTNGVPRESGFDITAASEIMAILCLSRDADDLRRRLDRMLMGHTADGEAFVAGRLGVTGAMLAILRDTLLPNLVCTREGTPALVHGGPFANIAHGCSSLIATRAALGMADWVVTEAGFAFDLGGEKFFDIKCRVGELEPSLCVMVVSVRALRHHGGADVPRLTEPDPSAVERGLCNLDHHLDCVAGFGQPAVVALNRMAGDRADEIDLVVRHCAARGVPAAVCDHFERGGAGAAALAEAVMAATPRTPPPYRPLYRTDEPLATKLRRIATEIYGASDIQFSPTAERDLAELERQGRGDLLVCVAKTQASLSADPSRRGRPTGFTLPVRELVPAAGAGFVVALAGDTVRMPGLPRVPQARHIDLVGGEIVGLR